MRAAAAQGQGGTFFVPVTNSTSESQAPKMPQPAQPEVQPVAPPTVTVTATGVSEAGVTNDLSAAENALHAKMAELAAQTDGAGTNVTAPVAPASSEDMAKARAALEEKISKLNQQTVKPAPPQKPVAPVAEKPVNPPNVNYPGKDLGLKPIEAPVLPVSAQVQAQLQALDSKYLAGQISPEEYHTQRAAILAAP